MLWTNSELNILMEVYPILSKQEILSIFSNHTWSGIKARATKLGLKLGRINYNGDLSILLDLTNPSSCYWLGFLLADGNFTANGGLVVELSDKDENHLHKLCNFISYDVSLIYRRTKVLKNKLYKQVSIHPNHKEIISELKSKFSIAQNKTKNPPELLSLNTIQLMYLLIGFIDGDGSICQRNNRNSKSAILSIEVDTAWFNNIKYFEQMLKLYFNTINFKASTVIYSSKNRTDVCRLQITKYEVLKGLKQLAITNNLPILTRKWDNII